MASRASSDVVVRFIGDTGNLSRGLDGLQGRFTGVATSLKGIASAGAVVGAISFFKGAIDEAREAERVTRKTEQVIKSTGGQAKVTAGHIGELSGKMSELAGVDDEVIQQGANVLATFTKVRNEVGGGNDVFDQAAKVSLDMAAALDKTGDSGAAMQENAIRIGKALNDPINGMTALTKVGVTFTDQQRTQVRALVESGDVLGAQKIILRELQTEFGGMAEASADSMGKAEVSWGNFAESVGQKVLPAVNAVSDWALSTGIPVLGRWADTVGDVVEPAFQALATTGRGLVGVWQDMPGPIQSGVIALAAWQVIGDKVTGMFSQLGGGAKGFGDDVRTAMGAFDVGRVQGTLMALEERIPVLGQMGQAFRDSAGAGLALSNTMPGLQGGMLQFGSVVKGTTVAALTGLRSAAGGLISFLGGPWGLAFAGAAVALGFLAQKSAEAKAEQEKFYDVGKRIADIMRKQTDATREKTRAQVVQEAADSGLLDKAKKLGISLPMLTDALMGNKDALREVEAATNRARDAAQSKDDADGNVVSGLMELTGGSENATDAVDGFSNALHSAVQGNEETARTTKLTAEALGRAADSGSKYAVVGSTLVTSTDLMKAAIESAGLEYDASAGSVDQLRQAIEALTTAQTMQMDTLEGYEASLDNLDASVLENKNTLDIHTEAGRANRDALEEVATKSRDLMLADIEAGVPMNEALQRHNDRIAALHTEATATFGANSEANTLIDTYGKVPDNVVTAITTQGLEAAQAAMDKLSAGQFLLANAMPITPANTRAVLQERNSRYADGGRVGGAGGPRQDNVAAWLSPGEVVENNEAGDYYGRDFLLALNARKIPREHLPIQGFAGGGMVWPFQVDLSKTKIPDPAAFPGGASIGALQGFARAQTGKRYLWGATGPTNWDCSGLVGAIWALAHGKNPYQRYMTTASMGVGRYDMKPGRGPVTVYLGPGHTAANIGGLHAEAYGGNGTELAIGHVGTPLSYYNQVMHMAKGGLAQLKNDPDARRESFLERGWPEPARVGMFKDGGWLKPGHFAYNETSKPELVSNQDQLAMAGGAAVQVHFHGPVGSQQQLENWLTKSLDNLKRAGRLPK